MRQILEVKNLHNENKVALELTAIDNDSNIRKLVILLDENDGWFKSINPQDDEIQQIFAGAILNVLKKYDDGLSKMRFKKFKIESKKAIKQPGTIGSCINQNGEWKDCFFDKNGEVILT